MAQLSETVKELIRKARIVSFADWSQTHPLDAMVFGLEAIKAASLKLVDAERQAILAPYFEPLMARLSQFKKLD